MSRLRIAVGVNARLSLRMLRWNSSGIVGARPAPGRRRNPTSGTAPPGARSRLMMALRTSASCGLTSRSLSSSVFAGQCAAAAGPLSGQQQLSGML